MQYKVVEIMGGIGNQMFQYAFAKSLQKHLQMPILLDKSWYDNPKNAKMLGLDIFHRDLVYATKTQVIEALNHPNIEQLTESRAFERKPKILRSILKRLGYKKPTFSTPPFEYRAEYLKSNNITYFHGYFQNPRYYQGIDDYIKESLSPPPIKSLENLSKLDQILNTKNSIFIHIRRGDYLSLSWQIDIEYYKKAVATIVNKIENPHFFLFCVDREFAHNLDLGYPFIDMTSENISLDNHFEDLILMAHCQHGIVANSSYSWWAAYLIENPHKIIIAPTPWLCSNDEIICDDWIKIQAAKEVEL